MNARELALERDAFEREHARRQGYRVRRYFHDCLPGCIPFSSDPKDHVPLPGNPAPTCRVLYRPHLAFFTAGLTHIERVFLAANRIGKTDAAAYETRCHATGIYPPWWDGKRFEGPIEMWAAGDTMQTTRDIIQTALMGPHEAVKTDGPWTGMLDAHLIADVTRKSGGVANCIDTIYVIHRERHHGAPCTSQIQLKSYDQGRRSFQGTAKHVVWLDEEPPDGADKAEADAQGSSEVYTECLLRVMTTGGLLLSTFTPLRGLTPFLKQYLETAVMPGTEEDAEVSAQAHFYPDILDKDPSLQ